MGTRKGDPSVNSSELHQLENDENKTPGYCRQCCLSSVVVVRRGLSTPYPFCKKSLAAVVGDYLAFPGGQ